MKSRVFRIRVATFLLCFFSVIVCFAGTPLRKDQSIEETVRQLAGIYGKDGKGGLYPTAEQWRNYLSSDHQGPVVYINLVKMRDEVQYSNGNPENLSVAEAASLYHQYNGPEEKALEMIYAGPYNGLLAGDDQDWDSIIIYRFPSLTNMINLYLDPEHHRYIQHKEASELRRKIILSFPAK